LASFVRRGIPHAPSMFSFAPELSGPVPSNQGPWGHLRLGGKARDGRGQASETAIGWRRSARLSSSRREMPKEILMAARIGYLLPTREQVMAGRPEAAPLIALAERAADLGLHSIWVGVSLLARPRHDPLTLLAAVGARVPRVALGTA